MRQDRINRLERQEERLKHLTEPNGVIIYDGGTGELLAYDPRILEDDGEGTIIILPHNDRDSLEETELWRKAQADRAMRLSKGLDVATVQLVSNISNGD